jgi:hypothetical protein
MKKPKKNPRGVYWQIFKRSADGFRYLTRMSDGSPRWTLTRDDTNRYTKTDAMKVWRQIRSNVADETGVISRNVDPYDGKRATNPRKGIPKGARDLALKHRVNLGRDEHGNYYISNGGKKVMTTAAKSPTATHAKSLVRRYVRQYASNPRKRRAKNPGHTATSRFQITKFADGHPWFWSGSRWTANRTDAALYRSVKIAKAIARLSKSTVAVVSQHEHVSEIVRFLTGKR